MHRGHVCQQAHSVYQGQHGWLSTDNPSVLSFEEKKGRHRGISSFVILVLVNRKGTSLQTLGFVTVLYFRAQCRKDVGCVVLNSLCLPIEEGQHEPPTLLSLIFTRRSFVRDEGELPNSAFGLCSCVHIAEPQMTAAGASTGTIPLMALPATSWCSSALCSHSSLLQRGCT